MNNSPYSSEEPSDTNWTMNDGKLVQLQRRMENWAIRQIGKRLTAIVQAVNEVFISFVF